MYSTRRRLTMSSCARSTFESMVFHSSTLVRAQTMTQTAGHVYGCTPNIHPTGDAEPTEDPLHERVYKTLFTKEHLFEVAVMYLFNGLKPTHAPKEGAPKEAGTLELMHYLAYIVPEADKLHVTDLNGHPNHGDRMEHVRVIFDPIDFRFRVIVKRMSGHGWVDISIQLRNTFMREGMQEGSGWSGDLSDLWEPLVKQLRSSLVDALVAHTGCLEKQVSGWLTTREDIVWEVPTYGADRTGVRNLFADIDAKHRKHFGDGGDKPSLQERTPFIVSYWADNYLQMDSYKVARMFNGLVGYGEFLYDHENNYTKERGYNNFFIAETVPAGESPGPGAEKKTWLWADMPYSDPHAPLSTAAATSNTGPVHAVASLQQRTHVLEAFLEGETLYLAAGFLEIVARRHRSTMQGLQRDLMEAVHDEHTSRPSRPYYTSYAQLRVKIEEFLEKLEPFARPSQATDDATSRQAVDDATNGHLDKNILQTTYDHLELALKPLLNRPIESHEPVSKLLRHLLATKIHIARERWLLDKHTCQMQDAQLETIQATYYTGFWDSMYDNSARSLEEMQAADDSVRERRQDKNSRQTRVGMQNNSALRSAYKDPALSTYEVAYAAAARKAGLVCDTFWCRVSPSVVQSYYDRKTTSDSRADYIGRVDLTSLLRSTNLLVRTFDQMLKKMKPQGPADGPHMFLQTTRTMFVAHGEYFAMQDNMSVYSDLGKTAGGRRLLHADDLVTFSFALSTMVDNPGIWNLLTAPRNSAGFEPKVANNGFVVSGYPIRDVSAIRADTSWENTANMTFKKLQVGIMRLPDHRNKARDYLHKIINNTRRTSFSSVQHSFESFMRGIYNSDAYQSSLEDSGDGADGGDGNSTGAVLCAELKMQGSRFVARLCAYCSDANMQAESPDSANYAFSALKKLGVELPTDPTAEETPRTPDVRYKCLFYILFGETIARWMADVAAVKPATSHEQQKVQEQTHLFASDQYQKQLKVFLETLTDRFFSGELHGALNASLRARFPAEKARSGAPTQSGPEPAQMAARTAVFEDMTSNMTAVVMRARKLTNPGGHTINSHDWRNPPSANGIKAEAHALLQLVNDLEALQDTARLDASPPATPIGESEAVDEAETESQTDDLLRARQVFGPYMEVYNQVVAFHSLSEANKPELGSAALGAPARRHIDHTPPTMRFFENRMLVMTLCEEQMHLIQRHNTIESDYGNSIAWCLLFNQFHYFRQAFAQMS